MENNQSQQHEISPENEKLKKQKKTIIIIAISLVAFIIAYFMISLIDWNALFTKKNGATDNDIYFYSEDLSRDLFSDETYMGYDRSVSLKIESAGITNTITDKDAISHGEAVNLLYNLVEYMIIGNVEAYNSCFSSVYYENFSPKSYFTKQKLYNTVIIDVSSTEKIDEDGNYYTEYYYALDYKIRHNNGTLRNDVGSDAVRRQHILLSDRSGEVLIDTIYTINYIDTSPSSNLDIFIVLIFVIVAVAILIFLTVKIVTVYCKRKKAMGGK